MLNLIAFLNNFDFVEKEPGKIFAMAKVRKAVWKEFQEVNSFPSYSNSLRWED